MFATGCSASDPGASVRAQILAASLAPWRAVNAGDGHTFCATVTPQLWAQVLGVRAASPPETGRCGREAARQISSGRLAWVARAMLAEQHPRQLVALTVSGAHATVKFRGRTITLRQDNRRGRATMYSGQETLTIAVPKRELVEVNLLRASDDRWRLTAVKTTQPAQVTTSSGQSASGFSETFYAYLSSASNNGSAFAGYTGYIQPERLNLDFLADVLGLATALQPGDARSPLAGSSVRNRSAGAREASGRR